MTRTLTTVFICGGVYFDTDLCEWVGCDSCHKWYHFKCAGFKRLPKKMEQFVRHRCQIDTLNFGLCSSSNF